MIITNLMKLAGKDMTTKHSEIKEFMHQVQRSTNYLTHKIAEGTSQSIQNSSAMPSTLSH